jgi:ABC-type glycerol-3-phosphate transport system substrate-binding protein
MKHRILIAIALAALACAAVAATAAGGGKGRLYQFRGTLVSTGSTTVQISVEGGSHNALKALIGQAQSETFTVDAHTEFLGWSAGVPHVQSLADLHAGDHLTINVRAQAGASLGQIVATAARTISDRGAGQVGNPGPLYLYVGSVAGGQAGGHVSLHVTGGNWRGLITMLGQPVDQVFSYDTNTIFLLWQGNVPTVIDPSQLKAGDRITIRIRAPKGSTLQQVEAKAANHIGDHEPGNPQTEN